MRRFLGVVLVIIVVGMIAFSLFSAGPDVADESALVLELNGALEEVPAVDALAQLTARGPALPTMLLILEMAAADKRIQSVVLHVRALEAGYARIQELRNALLRVREAGTSVVAVLDIASLNATREYYLASAADKIFADPGYLGPIAGVAGQYVHLGGFFERIGIQWEYERVGPFKSAVEMFSEREMSEPAREMTEEIIGGVFDQIVRAIAERRAMSAEQVKQLIERAPATPRELVEAGLIDGIAGAQTALEEAGMGQLEEVEAEVYRNVSPQSLGLRTGPTIALVFGDGTIVQQGAGPFAPRFATDDVGEAMELAGNDEDVRAVVLRINSGGGSALASEQLWRVVREVRKKKPVVVSMSDAAASGGYYVASGASSIVAQPMTLTGSIGVFFMRPAFAGLYEKLDIGTEVIARGQHAAVAASDLPFTEEQRERTATYVGAIYGDFLERVAEGRRSSPEEIDSVGQGRVWLGSAALERGLVDELGGLHEAVQLAKRAVGLAEDEDPARVIFPPPRSVAEQLGDLLSADLGGALRARLLPFELPEILTWAWFPRRGEVAYLPTHWVQVH